MQPEQDILVWEKLHSSTKLTTNRINPSPIIKQFIDRNITLKTNTPKGMRSALEIGVGIGRNIAYLSENNYCDIFYGIDMTEEAIANAKQLACINHMEEKCHFMLGKAENKLPFPNSSFDFVFDIMAALTFMIGQDNRINYSKELLRILKPGGLYFFYTGRSDGIYQASLDDTRRGTEAGTFFRSMDGTLEKGYTQKEVVSLFEPMTLLTLESQSKYYRAFGHQELVRQDGFWFGVFMKKN